MNRANFKTCYNRSVSPFLHIQMEQRRWVTSSLLSGLVIWVCYEMGLWVIPFITALVLAYAFHVPAMKLSQALRVSMTFSAMFIVFGIISFLSLFTLFLIPLLKSATIIMMHNLPDMLRTFQEYVNNTFHNFVAYFGVEKNFDVNIIFNEYFRTFILNLPNRILDFIGTGITAIYSIVFVFMTPVVTFYLLKDWEKFEASFAGLLHKFASQSFIEILNSINSKLGLYIRGQVVVCAILAIIYTFGLLCIGVNRFLVCGIISGMLAIVPFFGGLMGLLITFATSLNCFSSPYQYFLIVLLYLVVPFVDSNFITPKFIGKSTGIQPVWLIFSICACASVLGMIGIFISVPAAVILSTACKECIKRVK